VSAGALDMHEWVDALRDNMAAQLEGIHPSARCICQKYFGEMQMAVDAGDMAEFARLSQLMQDKVADESFWEEEKQCSAIDPSYVVRYVCG
jgi:hypothetical protein